jgi:3-oxoacyl-[acyl-carrier protein] reductase
VKVYRSRANHMILVSGVPNHALYAGSKAAVEGFVRSFSVDCGPKSITVNGIAPGGVKTDMFDE